MDGIGEMLSLIFLPAILTLGGSLPLLSKDGPNDMNKTANLLVSREQVRFGDQTSGVG
jgi:hypothetical protein